MRGLLFTASDPMGGALDWNNFPRNLLEEGMENVQLRLFFLPQINFPAGLYI